jgi:hypothetical protein
MNHEDRRYKVPPIFMIYHLENEAITDSSDIGVINCQ